MHNNFSCTFKWILEILTILNLKFTSRHYLTCASSRSDSLNITDTSSSFHTPDSRESNATISMVSDIESFAEETNVRSFPHISYLLLHVIACRIKFKKWCTLSSKISEHCEVTDNVEMQLKVQDIHEKQVDLESQHYNEQSIQCEKKHPYQEHNLNSPLRVDEIVEHFKTNSINKCHNFEEELNTKELNIKDNIDEAINMSSEESEYDTE